MQAMSLRRSITTVALCVVVFAGPAVAQTGGGYDLSWSTIDGGGATASAGGSYALGGTIGQPDAGAAAGGGYDLTGGFWAAGTILLGDCRIDGVIDLFDILEMIDILLGETVPTAAQEAHCNVDCDALPIDLFDVLRTIDTVLGKIVPPLECPAP